MGVDKKDVARRLVRLYCQMIFVDGVYHADPHPGNILVQDDGAIVLLDFGAVAELSPHDARRDSRVSRGRPAAGYRPTGQVAPQDGLHLAHAPTRRVSERIIEYFHRRFQEEVRLDSFNLKDIKIDPQRGLENLLDLRRMNIGLRELSGAFHIPKDWVLLERTILLLYGCCSLLDPELNPVAIIQPYLQDFVLGNRDFAQIAMEAVRDMAMSAMTLPEDLRRYLTKANRGELEVRVRGVQEGARAIYAVGRQIIYTAIGLFAGSEAIESWRRHELALARGLAIAAACATALLVLSSLFSRPRKSARVARARERGHRTPEGGVLRSLPCPSTCSPSTRGPPDRPRSSSTSLRETRSDALRPSSRSTFRSPAGCRTTQARSGRASRPA